MVWYKELGFSNNPFSIKPGAFSSEIVGYDLTEILKKIDDAKVLFIEGEYGFGKTSILKHIISQFGGQRKVAYYNCNRAEDSIDTKGILKGSKGFLGRMIGAMPTDLILLLDEVERVSQSDQKDILKYYQEGNLKSIVFFGPDFDKISFSIELRKLMVNNVIKLTELTEAEAVQLVRERIGDLKLLDDRMIKIVFRHSSNNPRLMLENLEDVVKYAVDNNEEQVTEDHLKEALGIDVRPAKAAREDAFEKSEPKVEKARPSPKAQKKEQPKVETSGKPKSKPSPKAQPKPEKPEPKVEKARPSPKVQKKEQPKVEASGKPKSKPSPKGQPKPEKPEPKVEKPRPSPKAQKKEQPKAQKAEESPSKKERARTPKETTEDEFEDKKPKRKNPDSSIDFEEETDYSEPADEEPGEDDKGGEYYYYY